MGFFDGLSKYTRSNRRDGQQRGYDDGLARAAADGDATRIRLSDSVHEGVSRIPPAASGAAEDLEPTRHAQPDDKPDPRAQWDGVEGHWIVWDEAADDWVPIS
jgi:hypothetical protein